MHTRLPNKKVARGPKIFQTNPPENAPAIIPVFSHTPPYIPITDPWCSEGTESDSKANAAGLYVAKPISNKTIDIDKLRKLLATEIPIMLIADVTRAISINNFLPLWSANIPIGTPNTVVTIPLMVKRIPTEAMLRLTTWVMKSGREDMNNPIPKNSQLVIAHKGNMRRYFFESLSNKCLFTGKSFGELYFESLRIPIVIKPPKI